MEIQFLHEKAIKKDPKLLTGCIRKMGSGEAPFFPTTLSLVYDTLVERAFTTHDPGPSCTEGQTSVRPVPPSQPSTSTLKVNPPPTVHPPASSSKLRSRASTCEPGPLTTATRSAWLKCVRCHEVAWLRDLHEGLYCPRCPGDWVGLMRCTVCNLLRTQKRGDCSENTCRRTFM